MARLAWITRVAAGVSWMGVVTLLVVGCLGHVAGADDAKWGPFRGRFVDADTGEPIRGAVAYAIWLELVPNPVHGTQRFYDVRFAVSDETGEFEIPAGSKPLLFPSGYEGPIFDFIAPGYQIASVGSDESRQVIRFRGWGRLRSEERSAIRGLGNYVLVTPERRRGVLDAINEIRRRMGLVPFATLGGDS
jgi:hypothetical protein